MLWVEMLIAYTGVEECQKEVAKGHSYTSEMAVLLFLLQLKESKSN